jgi:hypothetical protein
MPAFVNPPVPGPRRHPWLSFHPWVRFAIRGPCPVTRGPCPVTRGPCPPTRGPASPSVGPLPSAAPSSVACDQCRRSSIQATSVGHSRWIR